MLQLEEYNRIIVAFSGGKDSLACLLHLLDLGVPIGKLPDFRGQLGASGWRIWGKCRAELMELPPSNLLLKCSLNQNHSGYVTKY